jgi:pyruvate ferredoxin oxidoreductase gamma subunit
VKEIRLHGRGGQGVVTAAELIAIAAYADGKEVQAFPFFGSERMGAPVASFVRIAEPGERIRVHSQVYHPNYVIVQDPTLIGRVDVVSGLRPDGLVIVNTEKSPSELSLKVKGKVVTFPATDLALEILGKPIPNTALLGVFAAITGEVTLQAVEKAIHERFTEDLLERNLKVAKRAYEKMRSL